MIRPKPIQPCEILSVERVTSLVHRLTFFSEDIAGRAQPGQFVHIRTGSEYDPLLRRPFSLHDVDRASGRVAILFQVAGAGTRVLAEKTRGASLDLLGPLGRGFSPDPERTGAVVVAGGIGIAPFPFLVRTLREEGHGVHVLAGWRSGREVAGLEVFEDLNVHVEIATDDGSRGYVGLVTDLLSRRLREVDGEREKMMIYACGPGAMLVRVAGLAREAGVPGQVSVEERMACGIGACYGCAVRVPHRDGSETAYKLVCRDGPVFDLGEVILE